MPGRAGRPRKYGERLGNAAELAARMRTQAQTYTLHVYGALREVLAAERVVMLKSLRCPVRVVWVYRRTQWVALMSTDLTLTLEQIVEYYSARVTTHPRHQPHLCRHLAHRATARCRR